MKVGLYAGIFLSTPVLLWQIWGFVSPGLYEHERKYAPALHRLRHPSRSWPALSSATWCCCRRCSPSCSEKEDASAIQRRLDTSRLREEDALRFLRLGRVRARRRAGARGHRRSEAAGEGPDDRLGALLAIVPRRTSSAQRASRAWATSSTRCAIGLAVPERGPAAPVMEKRVEAVKAYGERDFVAVISAWTRRAQLLVARLAITPPTSRRCGTSSGCWSLGQARRRSRSTGRGPCCR